MDQFYSEHYRQGFADGHAGKPCHYRGCYVAERQLEQAHAIYREGYEDGRAEVRADYREECKADAERTGRRAW